MKWIGISGGWRKTNKEVEEKVRSIVRDIISRGDGIVSGGALGVDSFALDEALKNDPTAKRIKIFIPVALGLYSAHYRKRATEGVIKSEQAESLIKQLMDLKKRNSSAFVENTKNTIVDTTTYYQRNLSVVSVSDELIAFHIKSEKSDGLGTLDSVQKAREKGIPVQVFSFDLTNQE